MDGILEFRTGRRQQRTGAPAPGRSPQSSPAPFPAEVDPRRELRFLIDRYLLHHHRRHSAPGTLLVYQDSLPRLVDFFEQHGWRTDLDDHPRTILEHARAWAEALGEQTNAWGRPYAVATIHQHVRSARAFFNWLCQEEFTDFNFLTKLERPRLGDHLPRALSDSQVAELLRQPEFRQDTYTGFRNMCLVLTYLDTWARLHEIVDLPDGSVHIEDGWMLVRGKGNRERAVRFGRQTQDYLLRYVDRWRPLPQRGQDHFFLTEDGCNLTGNAVKLLFARIRARTGLPISAHRLRHTGATAGARHQMALDDIRKKLGHTSTKATFGYIHLAEQLPSPEEQPSGLDYLDLDIPRPQRPHRSARSMAVEAQPRRSVRLRAQTKEVNPSTQATSTRAAGSARGPRSVQRSERSQAAQEDQRQHAVDV